MIGALSGYLLGWLLGWSFVEPDLDIWAPMALILCLIGLVFGLTGLLAKTVLRLFGLVGAAYTAWVIRTMLTGDNPTLLGSLLVTVGCVVGWIYSPLLFKGLKEGKMLVILASAFLAGNLYGLIGVLESTNALTGWIPVMIMVAVVVTAIWTVVESYLGAGTEAGISEVS